MKALRSKLSRTLRRFCATHNTAAMLLGAAIVMLCGTLVRTICGSPYQSSILLIMRPHLPPAWLMSLVWLLWYAVLGATLGFVLTLCSCDLAAQKEKYRGSMLLLLMLFLGFLWYPLFFVAVRWILSALLLVLIIAACLSTAFFYGRCSRAAGWIMLIHAAFLCYMLILNIVILLCS